MNISLIPILHLCMETQQYMDYERHYNKQPSQERNNNATTFVFWCLQCYKKNASFVDILSTRIDLKALDRGRNISSTTIDLAVNQPTDIMVPYAGLCQVTFNFAHYHAILIMVDLASNFRSRNDLSEENVDKILGKAPVWKFNYHIASTLVEKSDWTSPFL